MTRALSLHQDIFKKLKKKSLIEVMSLSHPLGVPLERSPSGQDGCRKSFKMF